MHIAFRTDASLQIGNGHVMRCLALADALRRRGARCTFICRPHVGHLLDLICHHGHAVVGLAHADNSFAIPAYPKHALWLGTDWARDAEQTQQALGSQIVDWLVTDHYALDQRWQKALRSHSRRIMAIDDLADRPHDSDLLLDQNLGRQAKDYEGLINRHTQTLIGPTYALLRPEFSKWRKYSLQRRTNHHLKNLLITMGGVDQRNVTCQVLDALISNEIPGDLCINVVMGSTAPWLAKVQDKASTMPLSTNVIAGVNNMAQLMAESDLCIGAAGSTSWERCCLGLPAIQLVLAANQQEINTALESARSIITVDQKLLKEALPSLIAKLMRDNVLNQLSKNAANVCDGLGTTRTVQRMEKFLNEDHPTL